MTGAATAARLLEARRGEVPALAASAACFFMLLCGYYVLRPVRDEMGIQSGVATLPSLMTATFVATLLATPAFGALAARLPRARLLPAVYLFVIVNLGLFFAAFQAGLDPAWVARVFFVWLSVMNLFVVSVFWSFMADLFDDEQGTRLFPVISAGGSLGAICGPALTGALVGAIGIPNLMLVSAAFLAGCIGCIGYLGRRGPPQPRTGGGEQPARAGAAPLGGAALGGIRRVLGSPYLLMLCGYVLALSWTAVVVFLEQARVVADSIPSSTARTALFARIDMAVNLCTFACQLFATGRLLERLGLVSGLLALPALSVAGFGWLAAAPAFGVFVGFGIARRIAEYAIAKPAREVLYTVLDREAKYKAKNFIDTAVSRGGDALSGWLVSGIRALGATGPLLAAVAVPVSLLWAASALGLARRFRRAAAAAHSAAEAPPPAPRTAA